ncbi:hypothetical protein B0T26DRAFT_118431 [Lasiosphaeria miniovina]|uniref:Uncharacterized protein n=1 Tax=Lasiosphaeria miniovina TaxID=1954250 RepID=A0AA40E6S7_9PEZI|nr:uncharacterized protein B0T26DRAFT_118431 [Lasiosphaeria miniovina]KAK0727132.1 hypothetical protein B0T26DRAFT_118431 [Lasiosphaeria miniovina]
MPVSFFFVQVPLYIAGPLSQTNPPASMLATLLSNTQEIRVSPSLGNRTEASPSPLTSSFPEGHHVAALPPCPACKSGVLSVTFCSLWLADCAAQTHDRGQPGLKGHSCRSMEHAYLMAKSVSPN